MSTFFAHNIYHIFVQIKRFFYSFPLMEKNQKIKARLKWLKIFSVSLKENELIPRFAGFKQIFFLNASHRKFLNSHFNHAIFKTDLKEI
jgi:hypothetical protein